MKKIISLCFLIVFFMLICPVSAYEITYIGRDNGGTTLKTDLPSIFWSETCTSNLSLRYTAGSSGSFTLNNRYLSPDEITIGVSNPTFSSNVSCRLDSSPIPGGSSLNGFYESSTNTTYSAQSINMWLETVYNCDFDSNELFIYNETWRDDSYGNHPFSYGERFGTCCACSSECSNDLVNDRLPVIYYLQDGYYTSCGDDLQVDSTGENFGCNCAGTTNDMDMNYWIMTPFNSMASGFVNITIDDVSYSRSLAGAGSFTDEHRHYLWDTVLNTTTDLGTTFPFSAELSLIPERDYWLFTGSRFFIDEQNWGSATNVITYEHTNYSISIWAYEPDWVCGAWSDCIETIESRVCIDPLGRVPSIIEYRSCAVGVLENATLGFEESESLTATICYPDWNVVTAQWGLITGQACVYEPVNITIERPINWTVTRDSIYFDRYFMDFTSDWATEGTRSLKLWTIPPKEHEPDWSGSAVYCTNRTISEFPILENIFSNNSMRVNFNVTFPATNMRMSFDAKTCEEQVRQNYPLNAFNNTWIQIQVCPEYCYAYDCDTEPLGNFYFDLYDNSINSSVFGQPIYHNSLTDKRQAIDLDLTNAGLEAGINYTFSFAIITENPQDTRGNCIMLDNVRYDVLEESYLSILGGICQSRCIGNDYYQARELHNGGCLVKRTNFADNCMTGEFAESLENLQDICLDASILLHYNEYIADYEEIVCENGCSDGHCITAEEEEAEEAEASLYNCILDNISANSCNALGGFGLLISPFMIVNYIAMIFGVGILILAKENEGAWIFSGISSLIIVLSFWSAGLYPFEIGLSILALIGISSGLYIAKLFTGGGG